MNIRDSILEHYNIDEIIDIEEPSSGSGNAFILTTPNLKLIVKNNERNDFVKIYDKVQLELNKQGFLHSKIIKTKTNNIITPEGLVVYEYIYGENYKTLNEVQIENAISYLANYNKALRGIPFNESELANKNYWDWAKSLDFITNDFLTILSSSSLEKTSCNIIIKAINIIKENKKCLNNLPKQLIHSDLGADNFIFNKDEVKSIIDFTPEYEHEYYSLCHFVYWNYLYNNKEINSYHTENILKVYNNDVSKANVGLFKLLLVKASLFRVIGPYLHMHYNNRANFSKLAKRIGILKSVIL